MGPKWTLESGKSVILGGGGTTNQVFREHPNLDPSWIAWDRDEIKM